MGLFDRLRKKHEAGGQAKKPVHIADKSKKAESKVKAETKTEPAKTKKAEPKTKLVKQQTQEAYRILLKPLQTEKLSKLGRINQYGFAVPVQATKVEIGKAVKALYGVQPLKINCVKYPGKAVRFGRTQGRQKAWKKAYVLLKPGQTIDTSS
ncbi:50S ribosomal protein L23 [Candidatus Parcubacteria bacterium]|jgi:large subunit ribosomal protein L23|nr:MAG: 50S ribosomal protein L23 [Candidatus Parcubacteria bacterium]